MSKHTPGPWATNETRIESEHEHGWVNDGWIIAGCEGPDARANARLIAAAPDLLDACMALLDLVENWHPIEGMPAMSEQCGKVRKAIAKATGRAA
jgi:hypothetical protein